MPRTRWSDTAGLPLRTRLLCYGLARIERTPFAQQTHEQIAHSRRLSPAPVFPASLVIGSRTRGVRIEQATLAMRDGHELPIRRYTTDAATDRVLLYLHGGGWVRGRPQDYDSFLTLAAARAECTVVAPDYRKAPEHPAPQPVHDALDVFDALAERPELTGTDRPRIVVGGDSAGGNLSALTALHARDHRRDLIGQVLIYPATDLSLTHELRNGPMLRGPDLDRFKELYLGRSGLAAQDPAISPARADVRGVAPALVQTADRDPLGPEGIAYARLLERHGVPTRLTRYYGVPHGFLNLPGATHVGTQARMEIIDQLNDWWA